VKTRPLLFLALLSVPGAAFPGEALAEPATPPGTAAPPALTAAPPPLPPPDAAPMAPAPPATAPSAASATATSTPAAPATATSAVPAPAVVVVAPGPAAFDAEAPTESFDRRVAMWRIEMGYRGSYIPSSGFDPFSTNDFLPQFSVAASRTLVASASGRVSLAAGLAWDHGSSSAPARGDQASLDIERMTIPIEARLHFGRWGYALLRAAPGVVSQHAELNDTSEPAALTKTTWLFATDLSAGYAWLVWPPTREPAHTARLWVQADGGYGWVAQERLNLGPALASGDARVVSGIDLGSITTSGAFFRAAAAVSF
jgi:hypothetical protein